MSSPNFSIDMLINFMLLKRKVYKCLRPSLNLRGKVLETSIYKLGNGSKIRKEQNEKSK